MDWQTGDIAACFGAQPLSRLISAGTAWPFAPQGLKLGPSHVAIIGRLSNGRPGWFESTSLCTHECLLRDEPVQGCQVHTPEDRVTDYGGRVLQFRPHPVWKFDTAERVELSLMLADCVRNETGYDTRGALLSRSHVLQHLSCLAGEPLAALFCSELIALVLQRFGRLCPNTHPGRFHPGSLLRRLVRTGIYQRVDTRPTRPNHLKIYLSADTTAARNANDLLVDRIEERLSQARGVEPAQPSTQSTLGTDGAQAPTAGALKSGGQDA